MQPVRAPYVVVTQDHDWYATLSNAACKVLWCLICSMKPGGYILKNRKQIAKIVHLREDTVGKAVKELARADILRIESVGFVIDETKVYRKPRARKGNLRILD